MALDELPEGWVCSTGFCVLRPKADEMTSGWIYSVVRSDWFVSQVVRHDEKNAYPSVSDDEVCAVEIPVPPLPEQRRLVARIEALTDRFYVDTNVWFWTVYARLGGSQTRRQAPRGSGTESWRQIFRERCLPISTWPGSESMPDVCALELEGVRCREGARLLVLALARGRE